MLCQEIFRFSILKNTLSTQIPKGLKPFFKPEEGRNFLMKCLDYALKTTLIREDPENSSQLQKQLVTALLNNPKRYGLTLKGPQCQIIILMTIDGQLLFLKLFIIFSDFYIIDVVHLGRDHSLIFHYQSMVKLSTRIGFICNVLQEFPITF